MPSGNTMKNFRRVERLIFAEKLAGKLGPDKLRATAGCPVHDQHSIRRFALGILSRFAQRPIMNFHFR